MGINKSPKKKKRLLTGLSCLEIRMPIIIFHMDGDEGERLPKEELDDFISPSYGDLSPNILLK
jgi:hypothetical protein